MPAASTAYARPWPKPSLSIEYVKSQPWTVITSASLSAEEHGAGEIASADELLHRSVEPDAPLLDEDGAVGHCGGHVQRLLDDDHRHALVLEPLDDDEQLLHDHG